VPYLSSEPQPRQLPQRRATRPRPAWFAAPLLIAQIVVGGLIGLAAGYGIVKFLAEAKEKSEKQQQVQPAERRVP
jgi:hypothetical protein